MELVEVEVVLVAMEEGVGNGDSGRGGRRCSSRIRGSGKGEEGRVSEEERGRRRRRRKESFYSLSFAVERGEGVGWGRKAWGRGLVYWH